MTREEERGEASVNADAEEQFWEEAHERHEALLSRLGGLLELPMRVGILAEIFTMTTPREAVWHMGQILRGATWGRNPHIDAMLATSIWLLREQFAENFDLFQRFFHAAHEDGREDVLNFFRSPPPHRILPPESKLPEVRLPFDRDITLGERRSLASGSNRRVLERLLLDPSELVIGKLLLNPNLNNQDMLVITSRRPTTPAILQEVASSTRWLRDPTVREALVRNPFGATGIGLKLLPTLHIREIRQLASSGDLHPAITEFAQLLVRLRKHIHGE